MTIRFAAARSPWGARSGMRCPPPANDNGPPSVAGELPREALLHFAEHGLGAAIEARRRAEEAFFAGDRAMYHHWLGICRVFDKRLARALNDTVGGRSG